MIWYESAEEDFRREKGDIESNEKKIRNRNYEEEAAILNFESIGTSGELRRCLFLS